ncbi:MAG: hypothetical protein C0503_06495 [Gemmatimonas sp.]|nr:hypothetical protein [Gemmatimonas sp.]
MRSRFFLSLFALAVTACGPERLEKTEADLVEAVAEASARGDTATLWLYIEVPFAYDRVYIAGPRTPAAQIEAAMKSDAWMPELTRGIENADHFHLLLFETRGKLIPATLLRSVADIDPALTGKMYGPEDARFSVRKAPGAAAPTLTALQATAAPAASAPE